MNIWESRKWESYYSNNFHRNGIKVDFDRGVNETVKIAIKKLIVWLRQKYSFPKRVRIYVKEGVLIKARDGEMVPDLFFWPYNRDDEPYIKIATGDFDELKKHLGEEDALGTILFALLCELTHYYQWINNVVLTPIGEKRQARRCAGLILNEYANIKGTPI